MRSTCLVALLLSISIFNVVIMSMLWDNYHTDTDVHVGHQVGYSRRVTPATVKSGPVQFLYNQKGTDLDGRESSPKRPGSTIVTLLMPTHNRPSLPPLPPLMDEYVYLWI